MRRITPALTGLVLTAGLIAGTGPAQAAPKKPAPSHVKIVDAKNDVYREGDAALVKRKHGLDIHNAQARVNKHGVVILTVKVANLRQRHLKVVNPGPNAEVRSQVQAVVRHGKLTTTFTYGPGYPVVETTHVNPRRTVAVPRCGVPGRYGLVHQYANFKKNTVTFTIPARCLPGQAKTGRVTARIFWLNNKGLKMSDDFTAGPRTGGPLLERYSKPFRFR